MGCGCEILSRGCALWTLLKDHLRYFVTITRQYYIPITTRARQSQSILIKFLIVKERVQIGQLSIQHIGTNSMIADPLIKGVPPKVFHEHTAHMGVVYFQDI